MCEININWLMYKILREILKCKLFSLLNFKFQSRKYINIKQFY